MNALTMPVADGWTIARRNTLKIRRSPDLLGRVIMLPIVLILLFAHVFGSVIDVPGTPYKEFLLPGVFVQAVIVSAQTTGRTLTLDLRKGIFDRFRSLPMAPSGVRHLTPADRHPAEAGRATMTVTAAMGMARCTGSTRLGRRPAAVIARARAMGKGTPRCGARGGHQRVCGRRAGGWSASATMTTPVRVATRAISARARPGSFQCRRDRVLSTRSKVASRKGRASAAARASRIGVCSRAGAACGVVRAARPSIWADGSTPTRPAFG